jgi:hypothetical protein
MDVNSANDPNNPLAEPISGVTEPTAIGATAPPSTPADQGTDAIVKSSGHTRTAVDLARERIPRNSKLQTTVLYVAATPQDVEVIRGLGLISVASEGLESLDRNDVERLFAGESSRDDEWRHWLLLMDFNVAARQRQRTSQIGGVIRRLANAADLYQIDPRRRFGVCRPVRKDIEHFFVASEFSDPSTIRQLLEKWAKSAKSSKRSWRSHFPTARPTYSAARSGLARALERFPDFPDIIQLSRALREYRAAYNSLVLKKFLALADSANDAFEQIDLTRAVELAETVLATDPPVVAAERVLAVQAPLDFRELPEKTLDTRVKSLCELRRIRHDREKRLKPWIAPRQPVNRNRVV